MAIETLNESAVEGLLKGINIPPQPTVLRTVLTEKQKEFPDLRKIGNEVSKDVGLAAAMLRAANSPAFAMRQKITSIPQAVMSLGMDNAISLITGLSLRMALSGKGKSVQLNRFWDNATNVAVICAFLGQRLQVLSSDQGYLLGLFHHCGIPMLMQKFEQAAKLYDASHVAEESILSIEERELGTNHAVVGYIVARSWSLPEETREVILNHHDEHLLKEPADRIQLAKHVGLLALSTHLNHSYYHATADTMWERIGFDVIELLGLNSDDLSDLDEETKDLLSAA